MQKNTSSQITYWLGVVAIGLITGLGIQFVQAGWTEPSGLPGAVNVAAPINVSAIGQVKDGGLTLNNSSSPAVNGLIVANGSVGIGTTTPSAGLKIDVEGKVGATEYCDQNGNNCSTPGNAIPSGAVMAFNLTSCPSGWTFADGSGSTVDLRGVFVRGYDNGRGLDPSRALKSYQADDFKSHNHTATWWTSDGGGDGKRRGDSASSGGVATSYSGGAETRPKNVALLYCQKN